MVQATALSVASAGRPFIIRLLRRHPSRERIMDPSVGVVRRIEWRELFPWLILLRVFRIAISPTLLVIAAAAVIVTPWGWWLSARMFLPSEQRAAVQQAHADIPNHENSQLAGLVPPGP